MYHAGADLCLRLKVAASNDISQHPTLLHRLIALAIQRWIYARVGTSVFFVTVRSAKLLCTLATPGKQVKC